MSHCFFKTNIFCSWCFWPCFGCTSRVHLCPQVPYRCSWSAVWGCWKWFQAVVKEQLLCFPATALETQGHSWGAARDFTGELGQSVGKQPARQMSCPVSGFFYISMWILGLGNQRWQFVVFYSWGERCPEAGQHRGGADRLENCRRAGLGPDLYCWAWKG